MEYDRRKGSEEGRESDRIVKYGDRIVRETVTWMVYGVYGVVVSVVLVSPSAVLCEVMVLGMVNI